MRERRAPTPIRPSRRLRAGAWATLVLLGGLAAVLLLWPSGPQLRDVHIAVWHWLWSGMGGPRWFTPEVSEQLANALVLVLPLAAATILLWRAHWAWLVMAGALIGVAVEMTQALLLPERLPDLADAASNALGAAIGVLAGHGIRGASAAPPPSDRPHP